MDVFDPQIHLAYAPPTTRFTFEDLKLQRSATATEVAATVPFPILTPEGVRAYRRALFSPTVLENCVASPGPGTLTVRNAAAYSSFIQDFWTHPETLQAISDAAGVSLSVVMPTEMAHTNIQTSGSTVEDMVAELKVEPDTTKLPLTDEDRTYDPLKAKSVIPWHYDSYPYVCVIMLSDTEGMIGGQTFIKHGDGSAHEVAGPSIGYGVILQGGEVQHLAARARGVKERISTITSFTANVPGLYDSSYITNIRTYAEREVLYKQWTQYRLAKMKREIEQLQHELGETVGSIDVAQIQHFAQAQIDYLKRTTRQLISDDEVAAALKKYGRPTIYGAPKMLEQAETLPEFADCVASVTPREWLPHSPLWADLAESRIAVNAGRTLESQRGRFMWAKERPYTMGDELLRQGLPELLIAWLDATGLYALLQAPAQPVNA
ncbi:uncharacterized protein Z518_04157 [Rhinocladiella mackenziei CBS 650.93]|uniref:Rhinocladiella mackenziei CBS 650.93 unplaced genomic scaffold supercont1.3, whole genome shotgun sequence n=1 Tax=Rhinocladiella mackenziei CBS 650.93 TaxID=1442369 RepID=A0A0D2H6Z6_9EURO|nr:uncharacterized protein Z518_04157 [Rhinocladiella mackenziei CBS 650.93]KIX06183.1 hypothetical protein Z518_04157 [Rhinocladiella mackenziei CBS 650.93]